MVKNVILAAAYGPILRQASFRMFMNSFASRCEPNTYMILFTSKLDKNLKEWFAKPQYKNVTVQEVPDPLDDPGNKQRHWYFTQFLFQHVNHYAHGLTVDSRDSVFQSDPFKHSVVEHRDLFVTREAKTIAMEPWNKADCLRLEKELRPNCGINMGDTPINGGFVGGRLDDLRYFSLARFCMDARKGTATDQSSLIALTQWVQDLLPIYVVSEEDGFVYHGHHHAMGTVKFEDDLLKNRKTNQAFAIFHQWDRTPWKDRILKVYEDSK